MFRLIFVSIFLVYPTIAFTIGNSGCTISVNEDIGDPQPLLLKPNRTVGDAFYLPVDEDGTINFKTNQEIEVVCPGGSYIKSLDSEISSARASCVPGNVFKIKNQKYSFKDIVCSANRHTARYTGRNCLNKYKEIEIGFELDSEFLQHILICFDPLKQNTLYSVFNMTSSIGGGQINYPRPGNFLQGTFYDVGKTNVNNLYTRKPQKSTINKLVGLPEDSTKYIQDTGSYYLARGHFTAKSDFVFGSQHRLTFYFVNVAPQWQTFNNGNWKVLEGDVRKYASSTSENLMVYTGSYGVTTLPHEETGKDIELYLYTEDDENYGIPVPDLFWKVVYNPKTKAGTAFLGVNNPYHKDLAKSIICDDISDQIDWLHWNKTNTVSGYSYACTVDSFRKTVTYLPDFKVVSLLV